MIIAFSGIKFSGKDTAAEGLIRHHGFKRMALADKLKDVCSEVFDIPRVDMDDPTKKEQPFEQELSITKKNINYLLCTIADSGFDFNIEKVYEEVCKNFEGKILTSIRDMLQVVGTDICRIYIQDDIWLAYLKNQLDENPKIVITDARFKNERDYLKKIGATLILVKRPSIQNTSNHISENQLGEDSDYDVVINNISTITAIQSDISMWYNIIKQCT